MKTVTVTYVDNDVQLVDKRERKALKYGRDPNNNIKDAVFTMLTCTRSREVALQI